MSRDGERKYVKLAFYYFGIDLEKYFAYLGEGFGIWATSFTWVAAILAHRASQKDSPQAIIVAHLVMVDSRVIPEMRYCSVSGLLADSIF